MKKIFYKHAKLFLAFSGLFLVVSDYILVMSDISGMPLLLIFLVKAILLIGGGLVFGQLLTKYYTYANTDYLTGLDNRQAFYKQLDKFVVKCYKENSELSLLAIDIDKFKRINDNYGHPMGDKVLVQVGTILIENIRSSDTLARVGGEEFFILLPKTDLEEARVMAEQIKIQVTEKMLPYNGEPVTISIGISSLKGSYEKEALLKLADDALYKAKETRNTIVTIKN